MSDFPKTHPHPSNTNTLTFKPLVYVPYNTKNRVTLFFNEKQKTTLLCSFAKAFRGSLEATALDLHNGEVHLSGIAAEDSYDAF